MRNEVYLRLWGPVERYSRGTAVVMADRQIKRAIQKGTVDLEEIGNAKAIVRYRPTGKWFMISGGWGNDGMFTCMMGAACGDVAGSVYEHHNIKFKPDAQRLIQPHARFTDDTVMTCAVAEGIRLGLSRLPRKWMDAPEAEGVLYESIRDSVLRYGNLYPNAGYGGSFRRWLASGDPQPYNSWGNGSAMRASYAGWAAQSLEEAEKLAEISASVTHNHPEGIKGAEATAAAIFLARTGHSKAEIRDYMVSEFGYDLSRTCDEIRPTYHHVESCQETVPEAITAFLEGESFEDVLRTAVSLGGDSDTLTAIAGSIAEGFFGVPEEIQKEMNRRLPEELKEMLRRYEDAVCQ